MILETPDLILEFEDSEVPHEGVPIGASASQMGVARTYRILGLNPREVELVIRDVTWVTGDREVFAPERETGNDPRYDGIVGRHRLGIKRADGISYMVLAQTRLNGTPKPTQRYVGIDELDRGAGVRFAPTLLGLGATAIDSRAELLGDTSTHRNRLAVTFDQERAPHMPVAAFVLTRVAPVARGMSV
jgi:hypothetical protein